MERSKELTSKIMRKIRAKDSKAELIFRKNLFSRGLRYRKHLKKIPGTPDIVFVTEKLAIFIDGDFWHGRKMLISGLAELRSQFPNRTDFWVNKILKNIKRDETVNSQLEKIGWRVVRFWETEVLKNTARCVDIACETLQQIRSNNKN